VATDGQPSTLTLDKVVIALKPDKNPEAMVEDKRLLEAALTESLGTDVEVIIPLSGAVIREGFANGTVDIGYLSSTEAVKNDDVADILLAGQIEGKPYYTSYWIARKDAPYSSIADLEGQPVAFSSRTSTSGFLIPVWDLVKSGLMTPETGPEGFFGEDNVFYGTGYVSAARQVLSGAAEAAAVSYYVLDKDKHLSAEERAQLKQIDTQGPVPSHTFCVRDSLSASDRAILKEALLAMNDTHPELVERVFSSILIEVDPVTREALAIANRLTF
jgi:phosphonate transport system substrate-binding protein